MSRPIGTQAELERRRRRAVALIAQGESRADVARILGVHPKTLARWLRLARHPHGLDPCPHPGRPAALSDEQLRQLEQLLTQGAKDHCRRDKLSAISCITVSRVVARTGLHFRVLAHNAHAEDVVDFLAELRRRLGPLTVIWDRNQIHSKAKVVKAWLAKHPDVVAEDLPGYVPELNPDEGVWGWTKYGRLSNLAAEHIDVLGDHVLEELVEVKYRPDLLKAFIRQTKLPGLQR